MYRVIILPLAKKDILEAAKWYNIKKEGFGKQFTKEVHYSVKYIRKEPKSVAVRYNNIRCAPLKRFPFMIHYSIDAKNKTVIISAVFHTSLSPNKWDKRT